MGGDAFSGAGIVASFTGAGAEIIGVFEMAFLFKRIRINHRAIAIFTAQQLA